MKLDKNLTDSIDYVKLLFKDLGRLLTLVILNVIPIVDLVVVGYLSRVIKEPPDSKELPPLENYWDLWVQGLKIVVAVIVYMLIPAILIIPFAILAGLAWRAFPGMPMGSWFATFPLLMLVAIPLLIIGLLLTFLLAIILAMAIVNMVRKDSFGKAFAIGEILGIIGKIGWGTYILWLLAMLACAIIVGAVWGIPAIGWVLSLIIAPVFGVFVARSALITYLEGLPPEEKPAVAELKKPEAVEAPKEAMGKKFCVNCGAEIKAEAIYCPKCGEKQ